MNNTNIACTTIKPTTFTPTSMVKVNFFLRSSTKELDLDVCVVVVVD